MKKILLLSLSILLIGTKSFSQSLTKNDFKSFLLDKSITLDNFYKNKFTILYSGPRKLGGYLTRLQNKKANEILDIFQDENKNIEQISYYLPVSSTYKKMYADLKSIGISAHQEGKSYEENNKIYYHLSIRTEDFHPN